ncbi:MAG: cell division protein FtsQ/DivIB [Lachnospiraceae bacterium]|nr:cell division protein FtsQ/DivIB [Lachnospiraceae bacterium]
MKFFKNHKTQIIIWGLVSLILIGLVIAFIYISVNYKITTVYVDGNSHYSDEEIRDIVMDGAFGDNSFFLSLKYKDKSIEDIPFIAKMDVAVVDPNTIRIKVYEKAIAGCVEYLDNYMYFDKDGVVIESSDHKGTGIPIVTGLEFDHIILREPLPIDNNEVFGAILNITQLTEKYELSVDKIHFSKDGSVFLYFKNVRVNLGQPSDMDEKIMRLPKILPSLEYRKGILRMENYTEDTQNVSFEPDDDESEAIG